MATIDELRARVAALTQDSADMLGRAGDYTVDYSDWDADVDAIDRETEIITDLLADLKATSTAIGELIAQTQAFAQEAGKASAAAEALYDEATDLEGDAEGIDDLSFEIGAMQESLEALATRRREVESGEAGKGLRKSQLPRKARTKPLQHKIIASALSILIGLPIVAGAVWLMEYMERPSADSLDRAIAEAQERADDTREQLRQLEAAIPKLEAERGKMDDDKSVKACRAKGDVVYGTFGDRSNRDSVETMQRMAEGIGAHGLYR